MMEKTMEFLNEVCEELRPFYPEADITVREVAKPEGLLKGISIRNRSESISPVIYESSLSDLDDAVEGARRVMMIYEKHKIESDTDYSWVLDWEKVRSHIQPRLVHAEHAKNWLQDKVNRGFLGDLRLVFDVSVGIGTIAITNGYLEQWGVGIDDLEEACKENVNANVVGMSEYLIRIKPDMPEEVKKHIMLADEHMYLVSNWEDNTPYCHGAGVLPFMLDELKERFGSFFLIPSSISEWILIPYDENVEKSFLNSMIQEVNTHEVAPCDILSDHVYSYINGKWNI